MQKLLHAICIGIVLGWVWEGRVSKTLIVSFGVEVGSIRDHSYVSRYTVD